MTVFSQQLNGSMLQHKSAKGGHGFESSHNSTIHVVFTHYMHRVKYCLLVLFMGPSVSSLWKKL